MYVAGKRRRENEPHSMHAESEPEILSHRGNITDGIRSTECTSAHPGADISIEEHQYDLACNAYEKKLTRRMSHCEHLRLLWALGWRLTEQPNAAASKLLGRVHGG